MAKFCIKCGNPLKENQKFCIKCGAKTVTPSSDSVIQQVPTQQPPQQPTMKPNILQNKLFMGIIAIVVVIIIIMAIFLISLDGSDDKKNDINSYNGIIGKWIDKDGNPWIFKSDNTFETVENNNNIYGTWNIVENDTCLTYTGSEELCYRTIFSFDNNSFFMANETYLEIKAFRKNFEPLTPEENKLVGTWFNSSDNVNLTLYKTRFLGAKSNANYEDLTYSWKIVNGRINITILLGESRSIDWGYILTNNNTLKIIMDEQSSREYIRQ